MNVMNMQGRDIDKLPDSERRLGLSATPFKEDESLKTLTRNNNLKSYFGDVVNSFSLQDALDQGFLCPL
jgi:superfamily II DNA or RNA helicase